MTEDLKLEDFPEPRLGAVLVCGCGDKEEHALALQIVAAAHREFSEASTPEQLRELAALVPQGLAEYHKCQIRPAYRTQLRVLRAKEVLSHG